MKPFHDHLLHLLHFHLHHLHYHLHYHHDLYLLNTSSEVSSHYICAFPVLRLNLLFHNLFNQINYSLYSSLTIIITFITTSSSIRWLLYNTALRDCTLSLPFSYIITSFSRLFLHNQVHAYSDVSRCLLYCVPFFCCCFCLSVSTLCSFASSGVCLIHIIVDTFWNPDLYSVLFYFFFQSYFYCSSINLN